MTDPFALACPTPLGRYDRIVLGHGAGGRLSSDLLRDVFLPAFDDPLLAKLEDCTACDFGLGAPIAVTTDSFVVRPRFFPGGDIGKLAICGTVNDLAVGGAVAKAIAAAFVLEEGLDIAELTAIVASMRAACEVAGVRLVAGDTKVVDRGKGDGVFITTTGVGIVPPGRQLSIAAVRPDDRVIVSGPVGDHGIAIMSMREGLSFETALESDCAALGDLTERLLAVCPRVRCMRDTTRGGVSAALHEIAAASNIGVELVEAAIPVRPAVRAACDMLGLDPLYVACEGRLVALVPPEDASAALEALRSHPLGKEAEEIGRVVAEHPGKVVLRTIIGGRRFVTLPAGEQLPRIC